MATDIASYLSFIMGCSSPSALAFEVPVGSACSAGAGITNPEAWRSNAPTSSSAPSWSAMFLTPPDVVSQTLLAVPICLLFELGW
jgi:sec-independent protein translocase protein TatC